MLYVPYIEFTHHARQRMRERAIDRRDIERVLTHGKRKKDGDKYIYSIPRTTCKGLPRLKRLEDVRVVCAQHKRLIITVFRRHKRPSPPLFRRSKPTEPSARFSSSSWALAEVLSEEAKAALDSVLEARDEAPQR